MAGVADYGSAYSIGCAISRDRCALSGAIFHFELPTGLEGRNPASAVPSAEDGIA